MCIVFIKQSKRGFSFMSFYAINNSKEWRYLCPMKWLGYAFILLVLLMSAEAAAQCSMCTKTAAQLGEKPAKGMNAGIVYLMLTPFIIVGYIGIRWWRNRRNENQV